MDNIMMKKYIVTVKEAIMSQYLVEAKNKEDAAELLKTKGIFLGDSDLINSEVIKVELDKVKS